jgi:iron complex transport system ATP-binding protein
MLEMDAVGYRYNGGGWIFRDHSFTVAAGEIVAVLGPNGRGKTTLLKTVVGLLAPDKGRVTCPGEIGYVPQNAVSPFPYTVLDMVLMGRARHIGMFASPRSADFDAAREALHLLGIEALQGRKFTRLSGGERQLVIIARALASGCQYLVLDEPASALDFKNQARILKTLRQLARSRDMGILLSTHFPQHAVHVADRALLMYAPDTYRYGPVDEVLDDEALGALFNMEVRRIGFHHDGRKVHTVVPIFD